MPSEILISSDPWENRVAILEDGNLAELYIEREEKVIGSIYKGKVQNVLPGMGAAFVDIGLGRNAFLYVDDINKQPLNIGDVEITQGHSGYTIGEKVKRGDDILVQIVKEPRGLKGARISTNISLPGRYLILMPAGKYSGVSRKIESAQERDRLKAVMKRIRPEGMATVVRTAAAGASEAELIADLGVLIRMWHGILETYKRAPAPSLLHKDMNLIYKAARDFITADVERVLIDDEEEYRKVRDFLHLLGPQFLDRVQHYERGDALFEDFHINDELQKLMRPKINLPSGGSIVIESTEALTVIDVNSGKFTGGRNLEDTIVRTNLEAASEIARQVRLRDIGGIVVVDFIDMASDAARAKVVKSLEDGLRRDRTRATIQSFSNLGLLEFTRKRIGKDLGSQLRGTCPTCSGMGSVMSSQSVAIETFRHIRHATDGNGAAEIVAHVAPTVAMQMDFWYEHECKELAHELDRPVVVRVDPMLHPEKARIDTVDADKRRGGAIRVGDEHEVELLPGRLPNATSAAAVVGDRIVEVENAASNAGNTARIRILDVDDEDDYVLAEAVTAAASGRRRRLGRPGKEPATAAQQAKQLRELAEEAANQARSRPPIGISTATEEEEAQDKTLIAERRGEHQSDAIVIGEAEGDARHKRRRRRRGRGGRGRGAEAAALNGAPAAPADERPAAPPAAAEANGATAESETARRSRRRRHRRRGRDARGAAFGENGSPANVEPLTGSLPEGPEAEPAPAMPRLRRAQPPAVPPAPNLPVAVEPQPEPQKARPVRRRRTAVAVASVAETPAAEPAETAAKAQPKRTRKVPAKKTAVKRKKTPPAKKPAARKKTGTVAKRRSPG